MSIKIVYDSMFGNTELVAQRIAEELAKDHVVDSRRVADVRPEDLRAGDVLIVGSPTQGGRPTPALTGYLANLSEEQVEGLHVAAFDTRVRARWVVVFGFAANRLTRSLQGRGAVLLAPAEGFYVSGKEGPMMPGELDRAASWAAGLRVPAAH